MPLRKFSKGMLQRVGIAQALINDPELVIFDEPMSGLDPLGRKEVRDLVLHLRDEGRTILFSSHILADAEMLCDRVAILSSGRVVEQGTLDELLGHEIRGVELVVEGIGEALQAELAAQAQRAVAQGARHQFDFDSEDAAEKALDRVRAAGGRIRSLTPRRKSLEDVFLARAGGDARRGGAA
jgi:ABC-2 type transport system ATP-binding protein